MSGSSPDDLAIAFRSVTRRLREAQGDLPPESTAAATADLRAHLEEAARLLGTVADPTAIGDAVAAIQPSHWDASLLERLRAIALEVGKLLRHIDELSRND